MRHVVEMFDLRRVLNYIWQCDSRMQDIIQTGMRVSECDLALKRTVATCEHTSNYYHKVIHFQHESQVLSAEDNSKVSIQSKMFGSGDSVNFDRFSLQLQFSSLHYSFYKQSLWRRFVGIFESITKNQNLFFSEAYTI